VSARDRQTRWLPPFRKRFNIVATQFCPDDRPAGSRILGRPRAALWPASFRIFETLAIWRARRRSRADLASYSDTLLRDIGISRSGAYREFSKPFWRE